MDTSADGAKHLGPDLGDAACKAHVPATQPPEIKPPYQRNTAAASAAQFGIGTHLQYTHCNITKFGCCCCCKCPTKDNCTWQKNLTSALQMILCRWALLATTHVHNSNTTDAADSRCCTQQPCQQQHSKMVSLDTPTGMKANLLTLLLC